MVISLNGVQFGLESYKWLMGRSRSAGSPICLSQVEFQTELDDTRCYYQLIIKTEISEKRRITKL